MLTLSLRNQIIIGLMLTAMMILTRGYNLVWTHNLADASWAVFFLVGIYLRWTMSRMPGAASVIFASRQLIYF